MGYFEAILLGIVQGLTEFLPVSSTGHVDLLLHFLGFKNADFNKFVVVVLHVGSLAAIVKHWARDLVDMLKRRRREVGLIVVGSIPAAAIGLSLKDEIEKLFGNPTWVCGELVATGVLLWAAERWARPPRPPGPPNWGEAFLIGVAQAVAILPGISRSGTTIGAGYLMGLNRAEAVRFSFLLALPAVGGAVALELWDVRKKPLPMDVGPLVAGTLVCFVVSLLSLQLLERVAARGKLRPFAWYCIVVGAVAAAAFVFKGKP